MKIALAINLELPSDLISFDENKWLGSAWIKYFKRIAEKYGHDVRLAQDIDENEKDIFLVQEDISNKGSHLKHAKKAITFCLESEMYSPTWYDVKDKMGFTRVLEFGSKNFYFPSFHESDVVEVVEQRNKKLCMIISNKHYRGFNIVPPISQLHDYRYQVIDWAKKNYGLDLYGYGWGDYAKPVEDKLKTLDEYEATIIIENDAKHGYFTEKYVHAMIRGCMPIYYGDPSTYPFRSAAPADIRKSLSEISYQTTFEDFIDFRRMWLRDESHKYTYEFFAKNMLNVLESL